MSVDYGDVGSGLSTVFAAIAIFILVILLLTIALYVYTAIVESKILKKANHQNPWAGWVPVYNMWALAEISGYPGWMGLLLFGVTLIPVIGTIAFIVIIILIYNKLSKSFGKDAGFTVGLFFLAPVFLGILAFGSAEYIGPDGVKGTNPEWANKETPTVEVRDHKEETDDKE